MKHLLVLLAAGSLCACSTTRPAPIVRAIPVPKVDRQIERASAVSVAVKSAREDAGKAKVAAAEATAAVERGDKEGALRLLALTTQELDTMTAKLLTAQTEGDALKAELVKVRPQLAAVEKERDEIVAVNKELSAEVTRHLAFEASMKHWFGLGAVWYGLRIFALWLAGALVVIGAGWAVLALFFPPAASLGFRFLGFFIPKFRSPS